MPATIIGIMGPGEKATAYDLKNAHEIGKLCAGAGYVVMTGGRPIGVMQAGLQGAKEAGGQTLAILPSKSKSDASPYADIVVATGLNSARNFVNILTSDVIVACGIEAGTLSEIALALKDNRHAVLLTQNQKAKDFLSELSPDHIHVAENAEICMKIIVERLQKQS